MAAAVRELDQGRAARAVELYSKQFNAAPSESVAKKLMAALRDYLGE